LTTAKFMKTPKTSARSLSRQAPAAAIAAAALLLLGAAASSSAPARAAAPPPAPQAAAAPSTPTDPEKQEGFSERVVVREIEVVVELPASLHESRRKALLPQEFQVLEDGTFRQVVKAGPVASGDAAPWHVVLYFDRVLASPATIFFTNA
jgi:hypothetical protein